MAPPFPLPLLAALAVSSNRLAPFTASPASKDELAVLSCWDGVFPPATLASILQGGKVRRHSFTAVFDRHSPSSSTLDAASAGEGTVGRSSLEVAVSSLLDDLGDASRYVEYWYRDPPDLPRTLEVHRDVDEALCKWSQVPAALGSSRRVGRQRCPNFGHVLYVDVEGEGRDAPTLVWEEEAEDGGRSGGFHSPGAGPPRPVTALWPVAAETNRLLRFRGDRLHAVSYPSDAFLVNGGDLSAGSGSGSRGATTESKAKWKGSRRRNRRAVLLFNVWDDPPLHPPVGESLPDSELQYARELMDNSAGVPRMPICRPMGEWRSTPIVPPPSLSDWNAPRERQMAFRISAPLLGGPERRGCSEDRIEHLADDGVRRALRSRGEVRGVALRPIPRPA